MTYHTGYDLILHLERQAKWSRRTFGRGRRIKGLVKHVWSELWEILEARSDEDLLGEWIDVVVLGFDGALRLARPEQVVAALHAKMEQNYVRQWPAPQGQDQPVEHIREAKS